MALPTVIIRGSYLIFVEVHVYIHVVVRAKQIFTWGFTGYLC